MCSDCPAESGSRSRVREPPRVGQVRPRHFYTGGFGQIVASAVEGSYRTNELYAETLIPIFGARRTYRRCTELELEGAVRRVNNSIAGTSTTWTGGIRWSPIQDVQFRANKTKSIRAPAVTELFLPSATSFEFANDPCDKNLRCPGAGTRNARDELRDRGNQHRDLLLPTSSTRPRRVLTSGNTSLDSETPTPRHLASYCGRAGYLISTSRSTTSTSRCTNAIELLNLQADPGCLL